MSEPQKYLACMAGRPSIPIEGDADMQMFRARGFRIVDLGCASVVSVTVPSLEPPSPVTVPSDAADAAPLPRRGKRK